MRFTEWKSESNFTTHYSGQKDTGRQVSQRKNNTPDGAKEEVDMRVTLKWAHFEKSSKISPAVLKIWASKKVRLKEKVERTQVCGQHCSLVL